MNNVGEKYLPIGTVVMLKGGTKRVMITGFCSMPAEDQGQMYDYSGCMYPEGFLSSDQTALFNHDQIAQVYHMGLIDDEEKQFKTNLKALADQINAKVAPAPSAPVAPQSAPTAPAVEEPVPPVGPGLPGYVAPAPVAPVAPTAPAAPQGEYQFDANGNVVAAPAEKPAESLANIQFDENGTVVSA